MEVRCSRCEALIDPSLDAKVGEDWICHRHADQKPPRVESFGSDFERLTAESGGTFIGADHGAIIHKICKRIGDHPEHYRDGVCYAITLLFVVCFPPEEFSRYCSGFQEFCEGKAGGDVIFQLHAMERSTATLVERKATYDVWSLVPFSGQFLAPVPDGQLGRMVIDHKQETRGRDGLRNLLRSLFPRKAIRVVEVGVVETFSSWDWAERLIVRAGRYVIVLEGIHGMAAIVEPAQDCYIFFDCDFGHAIFKTLQQLQVFAACWLEKSVALYDQKVIRVLWCQNLGTYELKK